METGINSSFLYSACKVNATFWYEPSGHRSGGSGTGFLVMNRHSQLVLVTNRHVVDAVWLKGEVADGATLAELSVDVWENQATRRRLHLRPEAVQVHPDETVDVAAVTLNGNHLATEPVGHIPNIEYFVPWKHIHDDYLRVSPLIEAGEMIVMPGYPEWADQSGRPILRTGALASDPQQDYRRTAGPPTHVDGRSQLLFEAFSTSGNSGSPVFVAQRGFSLGPGLVYDGVYHPPQLVGINAGHIVEVNPSSPTHQTHVGLSRMYKTSAILELPNFTG